MYTVYYYIVEIMGAHKVSTVQGLQGLEGAHNLILPVES